MTTPAASSLLPFVRLDPASVDAVAARVAELLRDSTGQPHAAALVDAATVARALGIARATVYDHAAELGARRLTNPGDGRRPRLRFDLDQALAAWTARDAPPEPEPPRARPATAMRRQRPRTTAGGAPLLPIREGAESA